MQGTVIVRCCDLEKTNVISKYLVKVHSHEKSVEYFSLCLQNEIKQLFKKCTLQFTKEKGHVVNGILSLFAKTFRIVHIYVDKEKLKSHLLCHNHSNRRPLGLN